MVGKIILFPDYPGTANRINRNERFLEWCYQRGIKVRVFEGGTGFYDSTRRFLGELFRNKDSIFVFQNRPRRNLLYAISCINRLTILELRDPIVYRYSSRVDYIVQALLLVAIKMRRIRCLARRSLSFESIETAVLGKLLVTTPEYGVDLSRMPKSPPANPQRNISQLKLVYGGGLYSDFYVKTLLDLVRSERFCVEVYGISESQVRSFNEWPSVFNRPIGKAALFEKINQCDFALSINDSDDLNFMPSKSFELLCLHTAIIHITKTPNDRLSCIIRKYSLGIVLRSVQELDYIDFDHSIYQSKRAHRFRRCMCFFFSDNRYHEFITKQFFDKKLP
jgi:hypothetical protein